MPPTGSPGRLRVLDGFDGERPRRRAGRRPQRGRPPATTGRWPGPATRRPGRPTTPVRCPRRPTAARTSWPCWSTRRGSTASTTTSSSSTRWTGPAGDAAVLRLAAPGLPRLGRGLALTTDSNPTWCAIDPRAGTAATVAEGALNVACAGARPMAVVNCLNFGNPEHPEVMWQLSEAIDGMSEACLGLGLPVIGGNVSLYNESYGADIDPTPVIGVLGLIDRLAARPPGVTLVEDASLVLLDASVGATIGPVGSPVPGRLAVGRRSSGATATARSRPRPARTRPPGGVRHRAWWPTRPWAGPARGGPDRWWRASTTCPAGGLGVALTEMAVRSGLGLHVAGMSDHHELFTEAPSRVVVCTTRRHRADRQGGRGRGGIPGARLHRRRPDGGGRAGRPQLWPRPRRRGAAGCRPCWTAGPGHQRRRRSPPGSELARGRRDSRRPEHPVGHLEVTLAGADPEVGLDHAVVVGAAGGHQVEAAGQVARARWRCRGE